MKLYPETLQSSGSVPAFVRAVWDLVGGGKRSSVADDGVSVLPASQVHLHLISYGSLSRKLCVSSRHLFEPGTTRTYLHLRKLFRVSCKVWWSRMLACGVCTLPFLLAILLLNPPSEHELEQFDDDPLEYIRLDLALPSSGGLGLSNDAVTRRQAAADVLRALVASGLESETTQVAGAWIGEGLAQYEKDKEANWKAKDTAIYLMTAVATRGSTTSVRKRSRGFIGGLGASYLLFDSMVSHLRTRSLMLCNFSPIMFSKTCKLNQGAYILSSKLMRSDSFTLSATR